MAQAVLRFLVGGPLCGGEVECSKAELRVRLAATEPALTAVYARDGDCYRWRMSLFTAELPVSESVADAEPVRAVGTDWEGRRWRIWELSH